LKGEYIIIQIWITDGNLHNFMKISLQRLLEEVNRDILGDRIREGDWGKFGMGES
jgi:hypothetical protein